MRAGWRFGWLAAALRVGGGAGLLKGISAAPWVAGRLRTNYFEIHFESSELVVVSLRSNSGEISIGIMYKY